MICIILLDRLDRLDRERSNNLSIYVIKFNLSLCKKQNMTSEIKVFERLTKNVIPVRYQITLAPDLEQLTFSGQEVIDLIVNESTNLIKLNSLELEIKNVFVLFKSGEVLSSSKHLISIEEETLTIEFDQELGPGSIQLNIEFSGVLNDKLRGFYRSKYTLNGTERHAAITQFAPTDARRAFPCWDEPSLKATFEINVIVPSDRLALSNMPIVSEELKDAKKMIKFEVSPKMSTYLVAIVIGDFDYVEDRSTDNEVNVRVYTPVGKREQGQFALTVATKALPFYKDYFGIAYPLPKMDLIAVADFAYGAMENW